MDEKPKPSADAAGEAFRVSTDNAKIEVGRSRSRGLAALLSRVGGKKNKIGDEEKKRVAELVAVEMEGRERAQYAIDLVKAQYIKRADVEEAIASGLIKVETHEDEGIIGLSDSDINIYYRRFKDGQSGAEGFPKDAAYMAMLYKGNIELDIIYLSKDWRVMDRQDLSDRI